MMRTPSNAPFHDVRWDGQNFLPLQLLKPAKKFKSIISLRPYGHHHRKGARILYQTGGRNCFHGIDVQCPHDHLATASHGNPLPSSGYLRQCNRVVSNNDCKARCVCVCADDVALKSNPKEPEKHSARQSMI